MHDGASLQGDCRQGHMREPLPLVTSGARCSLVPVHGEAFMVDRCDERAIALCGLLVYGGGRLAVLNEGVGCSVGREQDCEEEEEA